MREKEIQKIFSEAAHTYEAVNHILTMGLDILWRKTAAKHAARGGGRRWIDVCSGTGDMAVLLSRLAKDDTMVVSQDFSLPMLRKAMSKSEAGKISFCVSNACGLPFPNDTFDLVTISFATRNINASRDILLQYFCEFYRVLKPGGRFVNLETTQPRSKPVRQLFHLYVRLVIAPIGGLISGTKAAYKYLSRTIPVFLRAEELSDILYKAGFKKVSFSYLTFGLCAIHTAIK
ncbi:MAG: ubiquinone/menaquinone biosynthesis methyltransferase [Omnitrophica bacterium]|nr:ubiquinone/menaquinone biosynthesis methyltransferase [Candidatus Omnitrophota bacterium]